MIVLQCSLQIRINVCQIQIKILLTFSSQLARRAGLGPSGHTRLTPPQSCRLGHKVTGDGKIGTSAEAEPVLIQALRDAHCGMRFYAAAALEKIGPAAAEAVPALIEALHDPDEAARSYASSALESIPSDKAMRKSRDSTTPVLVPNLFQNMPIRMSQRGFWSEV
jgi:hypothetical protein